MEPVKLARALGVARIAFGVALVAQPERLTRAWLGRAAGRSGTQVAVRGLGARDLVLGAGLATAAGRDRQRWIIAGMVGDATDLSATLAAGRRVPLVGRVMVAALAGAGIAMGAGALGGGADQAESPT